MSFLSRTDLKTAAKNENKAIKDDFSKRLTCPISKTNARLTGQIQHMRDLQFVSSLLNVRGGILAQNWAGKNGQIF